MGHAEGVAICEYLRESAINDAGRIQVEHGRGHDSRRDVSGRAEGGSLCPVLGHAEGDFHPQSLREREHRRTRRLLVESDVRSDGGEAVPERVFGKAASHNLENARCHGYAKFMLRTPDVTDLRSLCS